MKECNGIINSFETFGLVDGPGVRFVIFLQGCNMRCKYCHNPETWNLKDCNSIIMSSKEVFEKAYRYHYYWGENNSNGGITVSGGEPLLQIEFLIELFTLAKENNVSCVIDTSGEPFTAEKEYLEKFDKLMNLTDLFIIDLKLFDNDKHKELTGKSNKSILNLMTYLSNHNKEMWIRRVLVPNLTDNKEDLINTKKFINTLKTVTKVEILPYHSLAIAKYDKLGIKYSLVDYRSPAEEEIKKAEKILCI